MAEAQKLAVRTRAVLGKKVNTLRRRGVLPGVVFGGDADSTPLETDMHAFELSYRGLPADRQRLFRRLGLHNSPRQKTAQSIPALQQIFGFLAIGRWAEEWRFSNFFVADRNVEARAKLAHYGLDRFFPDGAGAFSIDHGSRTEIARRALPLAAGAELVYVIGDTPADVECGKAIGARTLAVATGSHSVADLAA